MRRIGAAILMVTLLTSLAWQTVLTPPQMNFQATFAQVPTSNLRYGQVYLFEDAQAPGSCSGGGVSLSWCVYTAPGWAPVGEQTIYSTSPTLGSETIASEACWLDQFFSGAIRSTDRLVVTPAGDPTITGGYQPLTTGNIIIWPYITDSTVNIKRCNPTSGNLTAGPLPVNIGVYR